MSANETHYCSCLTFQDVDPAVQKVLNSQVRGVVLQEFGHLVGLTHEHFNLKGGGIECNRDAVIRNLSGPPNNRDADTIGRGFNQHIILLDRDAMTIDLADVMRLPSSGGGDDAAGARQSGSEPLWTVFSDSRLVPAAQRCISLTFRLRARRSGCWHGDPAGTGQLPAFFQ